MNGYNLVRLQPKQVLNTGDTMYGDLTMTGGAKFIGDLTGNADSATRLQTARNITIGNSTKQFDGSGDVSWTLDDMDFASKNHNHASDAINTMTGYDKGSVQGGAITQGDTLNEAIGKLENMLDGKSDGNHTHNYLPLTGGNVSGHIIMDNDIRFMGKKTDGTNVNIGCVTAQDKVHLGATSIPAVICSTETVKWLEGGTNTQHTIYSTGNKPTPAEIGAVDKSGDTMTGDLNLPNLISTETVTAAKKIYTSGTTSSYLASINNTSDREEQLFVDNAGNLTILNKQKGEADGTIANNSWISIDGVSGDIRVDITGSLRPNVHGVPNLGTRNAMWKEGYFKDGIYGSNRYTIDHGDNMNFQVYQSNGTMRGVTLDADGVSLRPYTSSHGAMDCGTSAARWRDVYATRGAFNGSDRKIKENIEELPREQSTFRTNNVTSNDFYEYVKNFRASTFNYKKSSENFIGIIADDIPQKVFDKIGVISKTEEEYQKEIEKQEEYQNILLNLEDDVENYEMIESLGITYGELKLLSEMEIEPPLRLINSPAQIAMLQEVLSIALGEIGQLKEEIKDLKSNGGS